MYADCPSVQALGLSVTMVFTSFFVTHVSILTNQKIKAFFKTSSLIDYILLPNLLVPLRSSRCYATIESALLSLEMLSRAPASKIENLLLVVGSAISLQDIAVNAASGNIPTGYHGAEKRSGTESPQKEVPFKLSRDYTFDEEGFED